VAAREHEQDANLPPVTAIKETWGKFRAGLSRAARAPWQKAKDAGQAMGDRIGSATEAPRARIFSLRRRAREHPTLAVGIVGGALVGIAWIAWAIYVTAENGANAGLGVLITWPVLIGALALIAAPFVLTWMLVKRLSADGEGSPPIAGGANGEDPAGD
jgi:hypothetical protein